jgi:hypothetical protein
MHGWLRLFIFAWPFALVFLLICFPAWRAAGRLMAPLLHCRLGASGACCIVAVFRCAMYRIYHFTVQMKTKHVH